MGRWRIDPRINWLELYLADTASGGPNSRIVIKYGKSGFDPTVWLIIGAGSLYRIGHFVECESTVANVTHLENLKKHGGRLRPILRPVKYPRDFNRVFLHLIHGDVGQGRKGKLA